MKKILCLFLIAIFFTNAFADIPKGNGTWAYDTLYNSQGKRIGTQPGLFANTINQYNFNAKVGHKITQVFSYGGDMEMYCQGSGGSSSSTPCTAKTLQVYYDPGIKSTAAYFNAANGTPNPVMMVPIVDGVVGGEYLKTFNQLSRATARLYADNVARLYCADDNVSGVQFDLEPFDINQPGQAYFFEQIAKNFAGLNNPGPGGTDPLRCVSKAHPKGRFFSVFTFSGRVNQKLADIFNRYGNGYVIGSLYDLGSSNGGVVTSVSRYKTLVTNEVKNMMARAKQYNVKYQFGIPASASVHEFESMDGRSTGFKQIDYVKAAMAAINATVRQDPNFYGVNVWGWNQRMFWAGHEFKPATPDGLTQSYLANQLMAP